MLCLEHATTTVMPCLEGSTTVLASEASHRSDRRNHGKTCSRNCNSRSSRFVNRQSHVCTASPHEQLVIADQQTDVRIFSQSARLHRHAKGQILIKSPTFNLSQGQAALAGHIEHRNRVTEVSLAGTNNVMPASDIRL